MERAAGAVVLAGFFKLDARGDHLDDVGAVKQVVDEGLRYESGHKGFRIVLKRCAGQGLFKQKNSAVSPVGEAEWCPE